MKHGRVVCAPSPASAAPFVLASLFFANSHASGLAVAVENRSAGFFIRSESFQRAVSDTFSGAAIVARGPECFFSTIVTLFRNN